MIRTPRLWAGAQAYPYWLNGAVALAVSLPDPDLTAEVHRQMDHDGMYHGDMGKAPPPEPQIGDDMMGHGHGEHDGMTHGEKS